MNMSQKTALTRWLMAVALPVALAQVTNAQADTASAVAAPAGTHEIKTLVATGVQVYTCEYDAAHHLGWKFKSPLASLYDDRGQLVVHHFAGPSWRADDGSEIKGQVLAQTPSQTPGAVPWLLLKATSTGGDGLLSTVHYVRRVDTVGGAVPSEPCVKEHETGDSPYLAHYVFLQ
jgi:Protein of unknown function (DUF3455)